MVDRSHEIDKFAVHNANELLCRIQGIKNLCPYGICRNTVKEFLNNIVRNVSFEKCCSDLTEALAHIRFRKFSSASECSYGRCQRIGKIVKHDNEYNYDAAQK